MVTSNKRLIEALQREVDGIALEVDGLKRRFEGLPSCAVPELLQTIQQTKIVLRKRRYQLSQLKRLEK